MDTDDFPLSHQSNDGNNFEKNGSYLEKMEGVRKAF
jgi:hypothetical protein